MRRERLNKALNRGWDLTLMMPMRRTYQEKATQSPKYGQYLVYYRNKTPVVRKGDLRGKGKRRWAGNITGLNPRRVLQVRPLYSQWDEKPLRRLEQRSDMTSHILQGWKQGD